MKKIAFAAATLLLLTACGAAPEAPPVDNNPTPSMEDKFSHQAAAPKSGDTIATMTTNKGVIKIRFFAEQAPKTVENFTELAKKGFYDGLTFHRVIPNFMIQGGDPDGNGTGGETWNNEVLLDEFSDELTHLRGSLSMANRGPNTGTSQFFIVQNPQGTPFLDGRHAVFGQVYEGLEVVDAIVNSKRDGNDKPIEPVIMEKVEISTL